MRHNVKPFVPAAVAACLVVIPQTGLAWRAMNQHEVMPVSDTAFEVVSRAGSSPSDYWCGAGDYARRVLGARTSSRVYLSQAIGPSQTRPGRKAVQFSLVPPKGGPVPSGLTLSTQRVGDSLSIGFAVNFCHGDDPFDPWDRMRPFN